MALDAPIMQSGGVSSFGYSGTIAHAVLAFGQDEVREALAFGRAADSFEALGFGPRGADVAGEPFLARCSERDAGRSIFVMRLPLTYRRRAFPWRIFSHHTEQHHPSLSDSNHLFCSPITEVLPPSARHGKLIHAHMHGSTAFLELNDPMRFNTFSADLGEDTRVAVQHLNSMPGLSSLVMQGSGPHFSVGGNPYALQQTSRTPFACFAQSLRELYHGFIQLRMLPCTTL